jgi:hypothetical protein
MRSGGLVTDSGAEINSYREKKNKNPQHHQKSNATLTRDAG